MVRIVVDNRVCIEAGELEPGVLDALKNAFTHHNPKYETLKRMRLPLGGEKAIIRTYAEEGDRGEWLSVPRGGMARVRGVLKEHGVKYAVEDRRCSGNPELAGCIGEHRYTLWPHQEHAVQASLKKQNCIVRAPTGSGKTTVGFALAARVQLPTLVIVNARALMDQWVARAETELGMSTRKDVGIVQGKRHQLRPLTIAMQKTLAEHGVDDEMANTFGLVLGDEIQLFAAKTFFAVVDPFPAKYRVGISADHRRKDRKEFLVHDLFGEVAADIDRDELEDQGRVLDVEIRVIPTEFRAEWYGMPEDDDSASREQEKELDFGRLLDEMAADAERNLLLLAAVEGEVEQGEQVLVMAHRREHCRQLAAQLHQRGLRTGFLIGGPDFRAEFERTLAALKAGKMQVGVGTLQAIGQGIDLPKVGRVGVATPIAGNRQFFGQVRGRVCRTAEGKTVARMFYLWDRHVFGETHLKNLVRWNRTVHVRDGAKWVGGRDYLKRSRQSAA